ncbi:hypothetical protein SAMN05192553_102684 [Cyclobacterium xiamenense]|uniref:PLD-like domain-containing protein n=1 Tax=Cyclobacterium xiamenense TaxID=1297121 RepID=A0A1H6WG00_9BACT|nr:hypothetical protein [Cyclobacterium xiamenense]SEJ15969.1 hypothetical protein SAMN05192553_102684 [Cyclobacterium xiamenense]
MKLFDLKEIAPRQESVGKEDKAEIHRARFENKHLAKIASLKNLMGKLPEPGEAFFLYTLKSFNAFTFITYIIKHCGEIEELTFSTYSINERILSSLLRWYDKGSIRKIRMSISESVRHRMPKVYDLIELQRRDRAFEVFYCWNHSKVTLIRSQGNYFVIEGSGNFSENALHEQYLFLNDREVYAFRENCLMGLEI